MGCGEDFTVYERKQIIKDEMAKKLVHHLKASRRYLRNSKYQMSAVIKVSPEHYTARYFSSQVMLT